MSLLEMYQESEKRLHAKFDEIHKACDEAIEAAGNDFLAEFKEMIANAPEDEFHEFIRNSKLDGTERLAALCARVESYKKKRDNKQNNEEKSDNKRETHVFVVELD